MRKLIFRFTVALLCFSLGLASTRLTAPLRSLRTRQSLADNKAAASILGPSAPAQARAASIAETIASLRKIKTGQFEGKVPRAAKPLLTRLKHQLRAYISDTINAEEGLHAAPQDFQRRILTGLLESGIRIQSWEEVAYSEGYFQQPYSYGDIYDITVAQPDGHPELLVATTTLGICCGEDTSLYVFKREGTAWRLVLAQEANGYDEVSGGQGLFQYAISPTDAAGAFFVITANVTPWCSSNWQTLRYSILRVGPDPYQPRTYLNNEETIFLNDDPPYKLEVKENGFRLEFDGECSSAEIMDGQVARKHVIDGHVIGEACGIESR